MSLGSIARPAVASKPHLNLDSLLSAVIVKQDLPALGVAVILDGKISELKVVGKRKYGENRAVTAQDIWHLGSDSKAFTATLMGKLVEMGKLRWDMTIPEALPEFSSQMDTAYRRVTLEMLLCHRGGVPSASWPKGMSLYSVAALPGGPREQRHEYVRRYLVESPEATPGEKFVYSNAGFAIAAAMAEHVMNVSYEDLVQQYVFNPLGIFSAGFGPMNTPGHDDQPWQHVLQNGVHLAIDNDSTSDNPPAVTPAGRIHMSLEDWSKFAIAHLMGEDSGGILTAATFKKLHSLPLGGDYGFGWSIVKQPWAHGMALTHDGSNTQNYASIWLAPQRRFGVLVVTNQGGHEAEAACATIVRGVISKTMIGN